MRNYLTAHCASTKQQVASFLAQMFSELAWKLPSPRKPWTSERANMAIFDAAALGVSYLASENEAAIKKPRETLKRVLSPVPQR